MTDGRQGRRKMNGGSSRINSQTPKQQEEKEEQDEPQEGDKWRHLRWTN